MDLLVVPGGAKGAETISQNSTVQRLLKKQYEANKFVGMICAGKLMMMIFNFVAVEFTFVQVVSQRRRRVCLGNP